MQTLLIEKATNKMASKAAMNLFLLCLLAFVLCLSFLSLMACGVSDPAHRAPVVNLSKQSGQTPRSKQAQTSINTKAEYVVQNGETLFSIAKKRGQDPQSLAIINGIHPPYKIVPGQKIVFSTFSGTQAQTNSATKVQTNSKVMSHKNNDKRKIIMPIVSHTGNTENMGNKGNIGNKGKKPQPTQTIVNIPTTIRWRWPVQGQILRTFQNNGKGKGIDIAGTLGKPIKAAAAGIVVYSGNGLKGYGNLIIIKHNEDFLSAYAHNRELRVKEGEQVQLGQEIALMGQTDAEQVKVHFEIRFKGKPVNPLKFLPKV